jgi:TIR domain
MVAWIFLCHASEDKAQVREVYHRLRAIEGFKPWLDEKDLLPGQEWAREIPRALQASDFISMIRPKARVCYSTVSQGLRAIQSVSFEIAPGA